MPAVAELFRDGRLLYSKVREVTRVVDEVDEQRLCELALTATASQLARIISGFRSADGRRINQQAKRKVGWHEREDGMVEFRARLPKDEAALLIAAIETASAAPDRSGEDRTQVVVHVSAEQLARNVPAGTPGTADAAEADQDPPDRTDGVGNVPAPTSGEPTEAFCHIAGVGSVEAATAQRHACDNPVLGAILDKHGKVLALGRSRRLVSKAQRRALLIRDKMCRYPGCHQTRHLKAHHLIPWIWAAEPTSTI
jgi:hypothetical protein